MAHTRSQHRDDFDVEARRPSIPTIIGLALVASAFGIAIVSALGAILLGR